MPSNDTPPTHPRLTLVLGGARSGKSRHAESLVRRHPAPWTYLATAQAFDSEMRARIDAHRAGRPPGWHTVEAPIDLPQTLAAPGPVLVDCLTLWLSNLLLADHDPAPHTDRLLQALNRPHPTVLVSNEVGGGIVPDNALARRFRDEAGILHQRIAAAADAVHLVVAGIPIAIKGTL